MRGALEGESTDLGEMQQNETEGTKAGLWVVALPACWRGRLVAGAQLAFRGAQPDSRPVATRSHRLTIPRPLAPAHSTAADSLLPGGGSELCTFLQVPRAALLLSLQAVSSGSCEGAAPVTTGSIAESARRQGKGGSLVPTDPPPSLGHPSQEACSSETMVRASLWCLLCHGLGTPAVFCLAPYTGVCAHPLAVSSSGPPRAGPLALAPL